MTENHCTISESRSRYAAWLAHHVGGSERLREAFASVPRERHLPPPPWRLIHSAEHRTEITSDPGKLYADCLVTLARERGINNGQPSLHAHWMARCDPQPGETVVHVGAGGGYYSAILSRLVGPDGPVIAFEPVASLAALARDALAGYPNVTVVAANALQADLPQADVIYVSAALPGPPLRWLDALAPGGRLVFPWRPATEIAKAMLVTRGSGGFAVEAFMDTLFIECEGVGPGRSVAFDGRRVDAITSAWRTSDRRPDSTAVAVWPDLWFSTRGVEK